MAQLIWTPNALRDVQRLYRFLLPNNPDAARRAAATIRRTVGQLGDMPQAGRASEHMDEAFRELLIPFGSSGYVALYHLSADEAVTILAVRHQKEAGY
ncbi:type II toxin-antitoxin system RelE/ParE family toxin [Tianweitania sp. BSSL-BM11]|uniref:Type II toxin-antitoxin system RelE/ParE family toxin n=1 Tax=Tianweitania aestuarii TaxID=2814886 RepID=A0ABS5RTT8_9HYPH|nr:type II toxin-antitoxin system RelE/ParE family toxin [Tianweitania aestuarii]MBS9719142.1 type II toxin-antitoxin system RelE/ParE family toxin [Tianweitania aestuarii]